MKIKKDELLKGSLVLFILINIFNLLNYIFQFSMARMLTAEDYGILAVLMSMVYIFTVPSEAIQNIISRQVSKFNTNKDLGKIKYILKKGLKRGVFFAFISFAIFFILSFFLSKFLKINLVLLWLTGIMIFLMFLIPIFRGILQGKKKFHSLGWNMVLESIVKLLFAILLVIIGLKVYGPIIAISLGSFIALIFSILLIKDVRNSKEKKSSFSGIYSYSIPYFIVVLIVVLMYSLDVIIARRFFSGEIAGNYAVLAILGKIIFFGTFSLSKTMFSIVSEKYQNGYKTIPILKKSLKMIALVSLIGLIIYFFFSKFIIQIFFGAQYTSFSNLLFLTGIAYTILSFTNIILLYGLTTNKINKNSYLLFIVILLQIGLFYLMHQSLLAYCIALIVSNIIFFIYSLFLIR